MKNCFHGYSVIPTADLLPYLEFNSANSWWKSPKIGSIKLAGSKTAIRDSGSLGGFFLEVVFVGFENSGLFRHPIDILVFNGQDRPRSVHLYQPEPHALAKLTDLDTSSMEKLCVAVDEVLAPEQAMMLWFGAQFERTLSKYENGESLVWRDAGALLATLSLVAECLSLNCCAIGITGEPFISGILGKDSNVVGVGGLLVGRRQESDSQVC
jgi:SagB-type dehydrogenase family enzyme